MRSDSGIRVSRRELFAIGIGVGGILLPATRLLAWQDTTESPVKFSSDVNVVNVLVSARDKQGKIVHDLTKSDFILDEDGHPQTLKYFAQQIDMPLTLGLLVDTSGSQRRVLDQERNASLQFFQHVMREDKDKAFVIHFDLEVELLQDLTSSRKDLESSLQNLDVSRPQLNRRDPGSSDPQGSGGGSQGRGRRGGTALYDAILLGSDELMKKQPGRKAMILLSDGVDNGSKVSLSSAIESAQRADTLVYSIRFADTQGYGNGGGGGFGRPRIGMGGGGSGMGGGGMGRGGGGRGGNRMPQQNRTDGKKILEQISRETGGAYFDVTNKVPLDQIYDRIEEDLRNQYSLGYSSDQTGSGYRKIHVSTKAKNAVLQTREGYYPK